MTFPPITAADRLDDHSSRPQSQNYRRWTGGIRYTASGVSQRWSDRPSTRVTLYTYWSWSLHVGPPCWLFTRCPVASCHGKRPFSIKAVLFAELNIWLVLLEAGERKKKKKEKKSFVDSVKVSSFVFLMPLYCDIQTLALRKRVPVRHTDLVKLICTVGYDRS